VRKYMAPMFDRWRQATLLGWRHRRGVEKLRIVSQERVCRAWFEKRQEEKRYLDPKEKRPFERFQSWISSTLTLGVLVSAGAE
jgi:hypothetical protein